MTLANEAERIARLMRRHEQARREYDEAAGAHKAALARLKRELDCNDLEQVECWIHNEEQEIESEEDKLRGVLEQLESEYGEVS